MDHLRIAASYPRRNGLVSTRRSFHMSATPPPGASRRRISRRAPTGSNQWKAWAAITRSAEAFGRFVASAEPSINRNRGDDAREILGCRPHRRVRLDADVRVALPQEEVGRNPGA